MLNSCPFPLKESLHDSYIEGKVFPLPRFCKNNISQGKCKNFYRKILKNKSEGLEKCPYGLMIDVVKINQSFKVLIGLNIEKLSERKLTKKIIKKNVDFIPLLDIDNYNRIKDEYINRSQVKMQDKYEKEIEELKQCRTELIQDKQIINNHLHELRKLNGQLKSQSDFLMRAKNRIDSSEISDYIQRVFSTSQLISVRLDTYDACNNSDLMHMESKIPTIIFKKVEKAFHCLKSGYKAVPAITLVNTSYLKYNLTRSFELLPFILIENAIKYSLKGGYDYDKHKISITFYEHNNSLRVVFKNWGPRPANDEIPFLMDRSRRSIHVKKNTEGHGLGLFIAKKIAEFNNVGIKITIEDEKYYVDSVVFSPFCVELSFDELEPVEC